MRWLQDGIAKFLFPLGHARPNSYCRITGENVTNILGYFFRRSPANGLALAWQALPSLGSRCRSSN